MWAIQVNSCICVCVCVYVCCREHAGQKFWHNPHTGESTWEKPGLHAWEKHDSDL